MSHLTRREALRTSAAGAVALALAPVVGSAGEKKPKGYTLPKLPYAYDALTRAIDEETMKIHHDKHHAAYVANANKLLAKHPKLLAMPVDELLANIDKVPKDILQGVINNAGGHSNHSIFWVIMGPKGGGEPTGALGKAITKKYGSFDKFQKLLSARAVGQFGSGWAWLTVNKKGDLAVVARANQDSPIMTGHKPIMGIDVWEHAYYLRYKNLRPKYVEAWWKVVDWKACNDRYAAALKAD
jgi:Fe-Mn family superoxide dismutase